MLKTTYLQNFCTTVILERFAFYIFESMIVLFMIHNLNFSKSQSYQIFAAFSAILYLTPLLGGFLSDKVFGQRLSILLGGVFLSIGYFILAYYAKQNFYYSLAFIVIGNGLFMPNISGVVANLFQHNSGKSERAFSIFYAAINVGALFAPIAASVVISYSHWHDAIYLSSVSVVLSNLVLWLGTKKLSKKKSISVMSKLIVIVFLLALVIPIKYLFNHVQITSIMLIIAGVAFIAFCTIKGFKLSNSQRKPLFACLILVLFSIVFSMLYQQGAMSLIVFTDFNVNRHVDGYIASPIIFRSLNPFFVVLISPFTIKFWYWLSKKGKNPSFVVKFSIGTVLMGCGFLVLPLGLYLQHSNSQISMWWIVLSYFFQTFGEILVSPVGLTMVSELSPKNMLGIMMGAWYFATAVANTLAGYLSDLTVVPSGTNNPSITSHAFFSAFSLQGGMAVFTGILMLAITPAINKLIKRKNPI